MEYSSVRMFTIIYNDKCLFTLKDVMTKQFEKIPSRLQRYQHLVLWTRLELNSLYSQVELVVYFCDLIPRQVPFV